MDRLDIGILESLFPVNMRTRGIVEVKPGTLLDIAPDSVLTGSWTAIVNGKVIHREDWGNTPTTDGMEVIFSPLPGNLVAIGYWLLEALAYAAVALVVNWGVGKLLGLDEPDIFKSDPDTMYSFNNLKQTAEAGKNIKVVYGEHALAGNMMELSLRGGASATGSTELGSALDVTIGLCEGEITAIDAISINGNDVILDTADAEFGQLATPSFNLGTNNQLPLGSEGTSTTQSVAIALEPQFTDGTGGNFAYYTTTQDIDKFRINLFFSSGLYRPSGDARTVRFTYEYRNTSDPAGAFSGPFNMDVTANHVGPFIHSVNVEPVDALGDSRRGTYEIRVRYLGGTGGAVSPDLDGGFRARWDSLVEIQNQVYSYPNLATVRMQIIADSSISGSSVPNIIATIRGRKIQKFDGVDITNPNYIDAGTDYNNPAWVALDICRNSAYGINSWLLDDKIDLQSFVDWADWCNEIVDDGQGGTEKRAQFDGVFEGGTSAWDALQAVCTSGRATAYLLGESLKIKHERSRPISQMFTMGNIGEGSFSQSFVSRSTRPTRFEVQYLNKDNNYQSDVVGIEDLDAIASGEPQRTVTIQLPGITRESQALRECRFRMQLEKLSQIVSFDADIDAVACEPGDKIRLASDLFPAYGTSGRVTGAGSGTNTITIDRSITIDTGITYKILIRHSADDSRTEATITSAPGTYAAGTNITTDTTWTTAPAKSDLYITGPIGQFGKDLIVTSIRTSGELKRTIEALVFDESIYDDSITTAQSTFTTMLDDDEIPAVVTRLAAEELSIEPTTIAIAWEYPAGPLGGAHVYEKSASEGNYVLRDTAVWPRSQVQILMGAEPNIATADASRDIAVVAFNNNGAHLPASSGATVSVTPSGIGIIPKAPTAIAATQDDDLLRLSWNAPTNADVSSYEVRRGFEWVGSRLVGTSTVPELIATEWAPTLTSGVTENYFIRPITASGKFGDVGVYTETNSLSVWEGGSYRTDDFRESGSWTGSSLSNMAVNSDGDLEITTAGTEAKWESPAYDMGSSAIFRFGAVLHIGIEDLNWASSSYSWKSRTGGSRSWAGYINPNQFDTAVVLEFRTRTTSVGAWSSWRPLTTRKIGSEFKEVQLKMTATPTDSNQIIKLKQAFLVIEIL